MGSLRLSWDDSLLTGDRAVDVQHKYLIDIINELADAIESGQAASALGKILNLIKYYAEWHFGREEQCMERFRCPAAETNIKAHAYFIETFEGFQQEYRASGGSDEIARRMYTTLTDWLVGHIKKIDGQLGGCVHGQ